MAWSMLMAAAAMTEAGIHTDALLPHLLTRTRMTSSLSDLGAPNKLYWSV